MGLIALPNPLTDGTLAKGSEVRANDDAIVAQVNGSLADVNVAAGAAINGSKLSNVAGSRVPTDRIEDLAVTAAKLASDGAVDLSRAVTTNHVRDLAITTAKLGASAVTLAKLGITVQTINWSFPMNAAIVNVTMGIHRFVNAGNYNFTVHITGITNVGGYAGKGENNFAPGTPIPVATAEVIAVYNDTLALGNPTTGKLVVVSITR